MGMPISSYSVLRTLALGGTEYDLQTVQNALQGFNLYAFILHDPTAHPDLDRVLTRQFDHLDYATGKKLLFFALVALEQDRVERLRQRPYYQGLVSYEAQQLVDPRNLPRSGDVSLSLAAIASALQILPENLPCIVVTSDFRRQDFFCIPTNSTQVEDQLRELGVIADRIGPSLHRVSIGMILQEMRQHSSDLYGATNKQSLEDSLAKCLSDVLSFIVSSDHGADRWLQEQAAGQAEALTKTLYTTLRTLKAQSQGNDPSEQFEKLALQINQLLALLNTHPAEDPAALLPILPEYLEHDTLLILKTAYRVYTLLTHERERYQGILAPAKDDWSPGLIGFAKVFEKEINLSVVQWLRQQKGIQMPDFFARPKPGFEATIERANLNMEQHGKWLPPGVGQSEHAFRKQSQLALPPGWGTEQAAFLLRHWGTIREKRNQAAHDSLILEGEVEQLLSALRTLADNDYFALLYSLKYTLRV